MNPDDPRLNDPEFLAQCAISNCPGGPLPHTRTLGVTWVEGGYENGRIGHRIVEYVPLDWLGNNMKVKIEEEIERLCGGQNLCVNTSEGGV